MLLNAVQNQFTPFIVQRKNKRAYWIQTTFTVNYLLTRIFLYFINIFSPHFQLHFSQFTNPTHTSGIIYLRDTSIIIIVGFLMLRICKKNHLPTSYTPTVILSTGWKKINIILLNVTYGYVYLQVIKNIIICAHFCCNRLFIFYHEKYLKHRSYFP